MENIKYRSAQIRGIDKEQFNKDRTVTFIASTNDIDRHTTRLNQDNWRLDNFKANPIIGYQHNVYGDEMCQKATPDDIIGKGKNIRVEDGQLLIDIEFKPEGRSELADKVAEDVRDGYLNAVSVGFVPVGSGRMVEEEDGREVYHFSGQELLELSVVNIPSNASALKKSLRNQTVQGITWVYRALGGEKSLSDIESMTIREIMDMLENKRSLSVEEIPTDTTDIPEYTAEDYSLEIEAEKLKLINYKYRRNK